MITGRTSCRGPREWEWCRGPSGWLDVFGTMSYSGFYGNTSRTVTVVAATTSRTTQSLTVSGQPTRAARTTPAASRIRSLIYLHLLPPLFDVFLGAFFFCRTARLVAVCKRRRASVEKGARRVKWVRLVCPVGDSGAAIVW